MNLLLNKHLFWDTDVKSIDVIRHKQSIIERVVERGSWQEFHELIRFYGKAAVVDGVKKARCLDRKTMHFLSGYLSISLEELRCYTQQPSSPIPYL